MILDEVHSVAGTKRGSHLALSLERLEELVARAGGASPQRIALSATVAPVDVVASFAAGTGRAMRPVVVEARKALDLTVTSPARDFRSLPDGSAWGPAIETVVKRGRGAEDDARLLQQPAARREGGAEALRRDGSRVPTHHGSVSRPVREKIETALKAGELPVLVATGSLELGIDVGHVDSVVLLESPKGIARGLQRVGRSGHLVGETARGLFVPLYLDDLFESAATAEAMREGAVEETRPPDFPLDVLAQQLVAESVARAADGLAVTAAELYALARKAYPYRALPRSLFLETLAMLSGKYPRERFAALAPKLVWDRATDRVTPLPGARLAALLDGGTIGDRGTFRAVLPRPEDRRRRARRGVRPRDEGGRRLPPRLAGLAGGRDRAQHRRRRGGARPARAADAVLEGRGARPDRRARRADRAAEAVRRRAARRPRAQRAPRRALRHDARRDGGDRRLGAAGGDRVGRPRLRPAVVFETFPNDLGDPCVVVRSLFGRGVNLPWSLVLSAVLREETGVDVETVASDDGILLRTPGAEREVPARAALAHRPGRGEGAAPRAAPELADVRRPLPRERPARAPPPAPPERPPDPVLAPADQGARPPPDDPLPPRLPRRRRDLPRLPARPLGDGPAPRPPRADGEGRGRAGPRAAPGALARGRVAPLQVRRRLHVRVGRPARGDGTSTPSPRTAPSSARSSARASTTASAPRPPRRPGPTRRASTPHRMARTAEELLLAIMENQDLTPSRGPRAVRRGRGRVDRGARGAGVGRSGCGSRARSGSSRRRSAALWEALAAGTLDAGGARPARPRVRRDARAGDGGARSRRGTGSPRTTSSTRSSGCGSRRSSSRGGSAGAPGERRFAGARLAESIRRKTLAILRGEIRPVPAAVRRAFVARRQGAVAGARFAGPRRGRARRRPPARPRAPGRRVGGAVLPARLAEPEPDALDVLSARGLLVWRLDGEKELRAARMSLFFRGEGRFVLPDVAAAGSKRSRRGRALSTRRSRSAGRRSSPTSPGRSADQRPEALVGAAPRAPPRRARHGRRLSRPPRAPPRQAGRARGSRPRGRAFGRAPVAPGAPGRGERASPRASGSASRSPAAAVARPLGTLVAPLGAVGPRPGARPGRARRGLGAPPPRPLGRRLARRRRGGRERASAGATSRPPSPGWSCAATCGAASSSRGTARSSTPSRRSSRSCARMREAAGRRERRETASPRSPAPTRSLLGLDAPARRVLRPPSRRARPALVGLGGARPRRGARVRPRPARRARRAAGAPPPRARPARPARAGSSSRRSLPPARRAPPPARPSRRSSRGSASRATGGLLLAGALARRPNRAGPEARPPSGQEVDEGP